MKQRISIYVVTLLLIFTFQSIIQAKAEATPPNLTDWLGSGETTGIFTSEQIRYNITSGEQYNPTVPQIRLTSNTSQTISVGFCVADFRLIRVEANGSFTQMDNFRYQLNGISVDNEVYWASRIFDYPSTYRFGVVIWNRDNGSVIGRLITTIHASAEPVVMMIMGKREYTIFDTIRFTVVNRGPPVTMSLRYFVYREVTGVWQSVVREEFGIVDYPAGRVVSKSKPYKGVVGSSYADLSQPGLYKVGVDYAPSIVGESGVASAEFRINSFNFIEFGIKALIGAVTVLVILFILRRNGDNRGAVAVTIN